MKVFNSAAILLMILLFGTSCERIVSTVSPPEEPATKTVTASFYGEQHAGLSTASGEPFNPEALTAAHRSYPFGTILKVTNPKNGKSVQVIINDRGPFVAGRSLDLSKRAAREIGLGSTSTVKVEVIKLGNDKTSADSRH